jgi:hypothetical protein
MPEVHAGTPNTAPKHAGGGDHGRDTRLHRVRRLDWRFLLRVPVLGHVAMLGDDDPELVQALRTASPTLSLLDINLKFPPGQEPRFDLVVLRSCDPANAARAAALLGPGGSLYWEIDRCRDRRRPRTWFASGPLGTAAIRTGLETLGLGDIRFHWHRPDFTRAVEIIPLGDDAGLGYALGGRSRRLGGRTKRALGRLLRRAGMLERLIPCMSVVATRSKAEAENV